MLKNKNKLALVIVAALTLGSVALGLGNGNLDSYIKAIVASPAPELLSLLPKSGPVEGGTLVTIKGNNFYAVTEVVFGGNSGTIVSYIPDTITVYTPAHSAGPVDVTVTTTSGSSTLASAYTYIAPAVPPTSDDCKKGKKVAICHIPSGDTEKSITMCLPESAIPAHLAHGDVLGVCSTGDKEAGNYKNSGKK